MIVQIIKTSKNITKIETIFSDVHQSSVTLNSGLRIRASHVVNNDNGPGVNIHLHDNSVLIGVPKDCIDYDKRQNDYILHPEKNEVEVEKQNAYESKGKTIKAVKRGGCRSCGKRKRSG
tara:strand:+ start:7757 stop:8113 length:357 start_codon:yes stop_codon:yes gene_type:complete